MANLIKCPTPSNFKSGKVSVTPEEVTAITMGLYDKLVIMRFSANNEVLFTKDITDAMIGSLEDKGNYFLMNYRAK
jgi:hypothetical protein